MNIQRSFSLTLAASLSMLAAFSSDRAFAGDGGTVFNEIMFHPATPADSEWVELRNAMAVDMDLSGWTLSGGVNFTFPEGSVIPAGGFLVVAANPAALPGIGALGPWTGSLNNAGETLRLKDVAKRVMDEVSYNDRGAWPVGADGTGFSLARKAGHLSGTEGEHWVASRLPGGTPGLDNFGVKYGVAQPVFGFADAWLYQDTSMGLAAGWSATTYTAGTGGWLSGNGALAFSPASLPMAVNTVLTDPASHPTGTYYFQKAFPFSGNPAAVRLTLKTQLDDGAVIYLNGQEVARRRMAAGTVSPTTTATSEVVDAAVESFVIPATALVSGTNTLSAEVHQAGTPLMTNPGTGGLTTSGMTLAQVGGGLLAVNYARQPGAVAFAKDVLGNGAYAPTHTIPNLTNGAYGNPNSWIGNSLNSYCGVSFGSTPLNLGMVAWGRDNTGAVGDRTAGLYTLEYTAVANPDTSTPTTGNAATGWATIGTVSVPANGLPYNLRHAFSFPEVMATGIRLTTPGDGITSGTCIDELEAGPAIPVGPVRLVSTGGALNSATNMALSGTAFAKDLIGNGVHPAHTIPHLNDGIVGNPNSWIGNSVNSFCGVGFATARPIGRLAFGRDNTGQFSDRTLGDYTVQYTTVANPNLSTPDSAWTTIGAFALTASTPNPSLRHVYEFASVNATGVRIFTPDGACIDELELYPPLPGDVAWGAALEFQEIIPQPTVPSLRITEIAGSTATTWRVEIQNTGATPVNVGGLVLSFSGAPTGGYTLPSQSLAAGAMLVLDETTIGFRPLLSDTVFLSTAGHAGLVDAATVKTTTRALDAAGRMLRPVADSFGGTNTFSLNSDIVINEVMYHFIPNSGPVTDNPEEWIELYNKGASPVSLAGWSLDEAVGYTFPLGTTLAAGDYIVVASDAAALAAKWPAQAGRIVGNFAGTLSNSGERIVLNDAAGNPADEVNYLTGGAWPELADGGGSSMELRDPRADRNNGASWAASDESNDTGWQTVTYTMAAGQTFGQTLWNEFRIGMLDAGECLVDDVSVVRVSNGQQLIQGGDFSSLTNKWRLLGNHGTSAIEPEPGNAGNTVLHVRATGPFSYSHNHIETTFTGNTALINGENYTVSFRARWLAGNNQLNTRAYYSRLARTTELATPTLAGTPGAANSRAAANIGPALAGLAHSPVVPNAGEAVTVSATANDPDGMGAVTLRYALNGSASFTSVAMTASGGTYSAQIPGQAAGAIVQFYVSATDTPGATSSLPARGAESRALYIVNDGAGTALSAHELRIVMLPNDGTSLLAPLNRVSDARIGGTAIYQRSEVFYDIGVRLQGTAAGRIRDGEDYPGYDIGFNRDHLFRGVHDSVNIDRSGRGPTIRGQDEIYVKHLFHRAGVPCTYDDLVYLITPNSIHTGTAILQMSGYESDFVTSQFGGDGTVFNLDGTYEPATTTDGNPESLKNPVPLAAHVSSDFTDLGLDKEQYRTQLEPRAGRRADDFSGLIPFAQTMALPNASLAAQIGGRIDVDEWMHVAAIYSLWGIADCYMTAGFPHNLRIHVPSDGTEISALPWDMDFVRNFASDSPAILAGGNLRRIIDNSPNARHAYYGHLRNLCNTRFTAAYFTPWLTHYGSVVGQSMTGTSAYIEARRASILSQLPANVTFAITTNGGADFSVNAATTTLAGNGWIDVREIRRSDTGAALDVTWTSNTAWTAPVALNFGANPLTLTAYDANGAIVGTDTITITSTLTAPNPHDHLRITEIHYNPADPATPAELAASIDNDDFEFIELRNFHPTQNLDISLCRFSLGIDFTFAAGTILTPGETIHVARKPLAFAARYGNAPRVAPGSYGPDDALNNAGETVTLLDATGALIESIVYDDDWYPTTDGGGYSLVVIAPQNAAGLNIAGAFRASTAIGGNPNGSDAVLFTGNPLDDLDHDGLNAFLEYALGTSDTTPNTVPMSVVRDIDGSLLVTYTTRYATDNTVVFVEGSDTLGSFANAGSLVSTTQVGGLVTTTVRVVPTSGPTKFFVRLKAMTP